ncbi:hypothetical protein RI570_17350 [Brucella pseudogrignonensis]|uniref:hypothetical protein n=1 Tax=Brucella pseudogrignonensis TaxID=419475 RepID=UPI0028BC1E72|nr:hypothetical protein [Brucella pseudogrignonensis]MDT6941873.1 hypothetical protein [Brucella pseudogrignonensis]
MNTGQTIIANAFNEWMRRYTEDPSGFEHEWQTVSKFLEQQQNGVEPDYGQSCAAYLRKLIDELSA